MRTISPKCIFSHLLIIFTLLLLTPHFTFAASPENGKPNYNTPPNSPDAFEMVDEWEWESEVLGNYLSLGLNWGFASLIKSPDNMNLLFFKSRVFGLNLHYNIPIKPSHFIVSCGIGLSHADYASKKLNTLVRKRDDFEKTIIRPASTVIHKRAKVKGASFSIWAIDFITDFSFTSNKEEAHEGFFCAIGGNIGVNLAPTTTIEYEEDKESKTRMIAEKFNIARLRYGILARIGWGRFGAFYHQMLSPLFNKNGPEQDSQTFSVGISIDLL